MELEGWVKMCRPIPIVEKNILGQEVTTYLYWYMNRNLVMTATGSSKGACRKRWEEECVRLMGLGRLKEDYGS